jgi:pimeloyl-ACP methyl ester carboxylesterase
MKNFLILLLISITISSCQDDTLSGLNETIYVKNNGADMPVYVRGNGASKCFVILVHGGPGGNGLEYSTGVSQDLLEEKYAFAYWDQRGQGMAQGHYSQAEITIGQMVDDLKAVVLTMKKHYGSDSKIFVLGHSWGGTLGTAFMIDDANRALVDGWIEADGAHDIPKLNIEAVKMFRAISGEQIVEGNNIAKWQAISEWAKAIDTNAISTDEGGEINTKAYEAEQMLLDDGILESGDNSFAPLSGPTNMLTSWLMGNYTSGVLHDEVEASAMTDALHLIDVPCLFLWGKYDFVVPPQLGIDAFNEVTSADKELVIFQFSGHSPMVNEPERFTAEISEFIDRNK